MKTDRVRQLLNLCLAIAQPVVALLVNLEITGPSIGAISNRYPTYVVPAGYAFSIWSLIFALSLGYGIWQVRPAQRENPLLRRIGWLTASALAASSIWMPVFQQRLFVPSLAVIVWLLVSLIAVVARIYQHNRTFTQAERWLVYVHFSIFLGWVTVATVANVGQVLTAYGWSGWGIQLETWGVVALILAGAIGSIVTAAMKGNVPYALAVIWALIAISVNQYTQSVPTSSTTVGAIAAGMALLVAAALLISLIRHGAWRISQLDAPLKT